MFREALGYPTRPPEGGRSVIAGGSAIIAITVCLGLATLEIPYAYLAAVGLLPWLLLRGYYVRVVRTTIGRERPVPPRFDNVRRLLVDGAIAVWIAAIYLLPAIAVLGPLAAVQVFEPARLESFTASVPDLTVTAASALVGLLAVVALMSVLGALYVLPVAVARFAYSGEWRNAIELRTVVDGALTEDYAIAWGVSFLLQVLLLPVAYLLRAVLLGFFLHFIVAVGVRYCYGQGVGAALGLDPVASDRPDAGTAGAEADPEREPVPAFTRIGTAQWGVSPGKGSEPMSKSVRPPGGDAGGTSPSSGPAGGPRVRSATGTEADVRTGGGGTDGGGGSEGAEPADGTDDPEDRTERWDRDLPSAVERVSGEESDR
jgi:hypothetical protein